MARFRMPDPKDRSPNNPTKIVDSDQVLGYYNHKKDEERSYVTQPVKSWYEETAIKKGWKTAVFSANQCILTADVKLVNEPDEPVERDED